MEPPNDVLTLSFEVFFAGLYLFAPESLSEKSDLVTEELSSDVLESARPTASRGLSPVIGERVDPLGGVLGRLLPAKPVSEL